jgi:hypothetical protein
MSFSYERSPHNEAHSCTSAAAPFSVEMCQHGTHAKPELSLEQMRAAAPAEGGLLLLPFGLSCRACDDNGGLVAGCAECEYLTVGEVCGGCRREWQGDRPFPASQVPQSGRQVDLEEWRLAVGLRSQLPSSSGPVEQEGWSDYEEDWDGQEWEEAESDEWGGDENEDAASWDAEESGGWSGQGGPAGDDDAGDPEDGAGDWGPGCWAKDRWGNKSWSVDFTPTAASTVPAAGTLAPDPAAVAASAATAAVQAVLAAGASLAAPGPAGSAAATPGADGRIRILGLELELEKLKSRRLS